MNEKLSRFYHAAYTEVEMIGALKQPGAGRTAAEIGQQMGVSKHTEKRCTAE